MSKPNITLESLRDEAHNFVVAWSKKRHEQIVGATDGKATGTYIEHGFQDFISQKYEVTIGCSASGIDLPDPEINTDMKTTFITQPQSSCPFKSARQKIFGLGYNLLLFVYNKDDSQENNLNFLHARFIEKSRTADYQTTRGLNEIINRDGNTDDIAAFLIERCLPVDEIELRRLAEQTLQNPPKIGYLTISNALQWRLQYSRVIKLEDEIEGIYKIFDRES